MKYNGDIICISLPATDGTTGEDWIKRTEKKGNCITDNARKMLFSESFKPTNHKQYRLAIFRGVFFPDDDRITNIIRAQAKSYGLIEPFADAACLLRELITNNDLKAIGVSSVIIMHKPIRVGNIPRLLTVSWDGQLAGHYEEPDDIWSRMDAFAFMQCI